MELLDSMSNTISPVVNSGANLIDKYTPIITNYIRENPLVVPAALGILLILNSHNKKERYG